MIKTNTNQTGRSMIEMLGVLAIIGVLTVGGFALISKMSNAHRANEVIDEIGTLANKTRMIFHEFVEDNTDANFHKMSMYVYKARAYPEGLSCLNVDNDGKCKAENSDADSFAFIDKNDVKFEIQHERSGNKIDYFVIKISQLSDDLCMAVAQSTWGSPSINGYVGMCVGNLTKCPNGGIIGNTTSQTYIAKGGAKLSLDDAADACSNEKEENGNIIYLTFR